MCSILGSVMYHKSWFRLSRAVTRDEQVWATATYGKSKMKAPGTCRMGPGGSVSMAGRSRVEMLSGVSLEHRFC